jgi:hypothetical protein
MINNVRVCRIQSKSERRSCTHLTEANMSQTAIVVQGIVMPDGTLQIAEKLNLPAGRVQVVVQPLPDLASDPFWQSMEAIWTGQAARGHVPRTAEAIESERSAIRQEMEEEIREAMRIQAECREGGGQGNPAQEPD